MPSTHKKVVVRKMDRDSINGHVAPSNFVREGKLELVVGLCRLVPVLAEASWRQPGIVFGHPVKIARCGVLFHKMLSADSLWIKILSLCSYLTFPVDSF